MVNGITYRDAMEMAASERLILGIAIGEMNGGVFDYIEREFLERR